MPRPDKDVQIQSMLSEIPLQTSDKPSWKCSACDHAPHGSVCLANSPAVCHCDGQPEFDVVCQHGTAADVHCCNCHSGFVWRPEACVCGTDSDVRREVALLRQHAKSHARDYASLAAKLDEADRKLAAAEQERDAFRDEANALRRNYLAETADLARRVDAAEQARDELETEWTATSEQLHHDLEMARAEAQRIVTGMAVAGRVTSEHINTQSSARAALLEAAAAIPHLTRYSFDTGEGSTGEHIRLEDVIAWLTTRAGGPRT